MGIFLHATAVEPFILLFLLGKLALGGYVKFAHTHRPVSVPKEHVCKLFPVERKDLPVIG